MAAVVRLHDSGAIVYNTEIYEILPGFVRGLVVSVIVALATPAPNDRVVSIFDAATRKGAVG